MNKHIRLFNRIAVVYGWFYKSQKKHYQRHVLPKIPINLRGLKVLDIGAGTGALSSALDDAKASVTMVDGSPKMLDVARKKQAPEKIESYVRNVIDEDLSDLGVFDVVMSAYLVHGLKPIQREILYRKMKQLASKYIVIYEHRKSRNIIIKFVEFLERGDYFNYVKVAQTELNHHFEKVTAISVSKRSVIYFIEL